MLTYEMLERAAIYQYEAGFSQVEAEQKAGFNNLPETTLTKPEYALLTKLRNSHGLIIHAQNKQDKLCIHRLIKKGILDCDSKGWLHELQK